jgi:hypothetical protein
MYVSITTSPAAAVGSASMPLSPKGISWRIKQHPHISSVASRHRSRTLPLPVLLGRDRIHVFGVAIPPGVLLRAMRAIGDDQGVKLYERKAVPVD